MEAISSDKYQNTRTERTKTGTELLLTIGAHLVTLGRSLYLHREPGQHLGRWRQAMDAAEEPHGEREYHEVDHEDRQQSVVAAYGQPLFSVFPQHQWPSFREHETQAGQDQVSERGTHLAVVVVVVVTVVAVTVVVVVVVVLPSIRRSNVSFTILRQNGARTLDDASFLKI